MAQECKSKLEAEIRNFKLAQTELQTAISTRQQLDGQYNENDLVKRELEILPADGKVYKSVGPVLIKTDLVEAKQNVSKRMDFINKELSRVDNLIVSLENKTEVHREALQKLQMQYQQMQANAQKFMASTVHA